MKIISWNVNGIRAVAKKDFFESLELMDPDVICLQETKAQDDQVREVLFDRGYHFFSNSAVKKGYSGTAILSKTEPLSFSKDIGVEEHDQEGRVTTAEFDSFYLVNAYVPNSQNGLVRLDYRQQWDRDMLAYLKTLEQLKPVIFVGDMNVAHTEIDIARPKANYDKSPGFTQKEINGMDNYISAGFIDSWRTQHPDEVKYSWWSYRAGARAKNIGWRIDYVLVSEGLMPRVKDSFIYNHIHGSDHCPVGIILD